ncbi:hypothetical protein CDEF62S_02827 [Castellaniella defragrans]
MAGVTGLLVLLSGCALSERLRDAAQRFQTADQTVTRTHEDFARGLTDSERHRAAQQVDKPWVAGRAQPLARELSLPPALRADVQTTLLFADGTDDLRRIARRLTAVTGIPVRVKPDALLPDSHFLPRLAGTPSQGPQTAPPSEPFALASGPAPLPQILDRLSAHLGVRWRHGPEGIEFFRTETRVFDVQLPISGCRARPTARWPRPRPRAGSSAHRARAWPAVIRMS